MHATLLLACLFVVAPLASVGQPADAPTDEAESDAETGPTPSGPPRGVEIIEVVGEVSDVLESDEQSSTTLFQAAELEGIGVDDVSDISLFTPNLEIRTASSTSATFFIRGVGLSDFSANAAGAVAVYLDDVPMNTPGLQLLPVFDVEGVSVLRGPQGTGAGRNASAGALKISSRKPAFQTSSDFSFNLGSIVSPDARDAFRQEYLGAIEFPLVEDTLGSRFAFVYRQNDPYIENGCGDAPPIDERGGETVCGESSIARFPRVPAGLERWLGEETAWAARGILRLSPPDSDLDVLLLGRGYRLDRDSTVGQAAPANPTNPFVGGFQTTVRGYREPDHFREFVALRQGFLDQGLPFGEAQLRANQEFTDRFIERLDENPYRGDFDRTGRTTFDAWGTALDVSWDGPDVQLRSITAFDTWDRFQDQDTDFTPDVLFEIVSEDEAWQLAQELSATGYLFDTPLRWDVGGNLMLESIDADVALRNDSINPNAGLTQRAYRQDLFGWLTYASLSLDFWDEYFTLDAGLRYNWERKDFEIEQSVVGTGFVNPGQPLATAAATDDATWQEPTYSVGLTFRPSAALSIYWRYTHGWKAGHFNTNGVEVPPSGGAIANSAEPEEIDAIEVGFSAYAWDRRLRAGGALFHYDYDDYQVFNFESEPLKNPQLEIINARGAENFGAELELQLSPLRGYVPPSVEALDVVLRGGWLNTEFLDFTDQQVATDTSGRPSPILADFSGNPLINAPELSFSGSVSWGFDFGRFGVLTPRWDFAWTDDLPFDATGGRGQLDINNEASKPKNTIGQPAYWIHNLRLGLRAEDASWEISAWCRNLLDQRYRTFAFDASRFGRVTIHFVGDPRTCGAGASFRF